MVKGCDICIFATLIWYGVGNDENNIYILSVVSLHFVVVVMAVMADCTRS